jgi:aspartate 1-decarboxylase
MIKVIRAKLHGLRVTGADITYHGSITLDPEQCTEAGIYPLEFVKIWNKNTGARISTYVIYGEAGSRCCILNGAAARTCQVGDEVIIAATEEIEPEDLPTRRPRVLTFTSDNKIAEVLQYRVEEGTKQPYDFFIDRLK